MLRTKAIPFETSPTNNEGRVESDTVQAAGTDIWGAWSGHPLVNTLGVRMVRV